MAAPSCVNSVNSSLTVPHSSFGFIGVDSQQKVGLPQIFRAFNDACPSASAPSLHQPLLPSHKVSPIRVDKVHQEVLTHPDQSFVTYILDGLQNGFHVGFNPALVSLKSPLRICTQLVFSPRLLGTFRSEDEDDYEYEFSVLSMRIRFGGRHFSKCACSEQETRTRIRPRPPI